MIGCEGQSDLRQIALDCAILKHNTVLGLVVSLDILEGVVVETLAGDVAHLEVG